MVRCIRCGKGTVVRRRICYACMAKWRGRRAEAYAQAIEELGPLTRENHEAITKRIKQLEQEVVEE